MYLLKAKKLHDKEVAVEYEAEKKERRAQRRQRRKERSKAREAARDGEWQDMDFNCRYMGSFTVPVRFDGSVRKPEVKQGIRSMRKLDRKKKPTLLTVSAAGVTIWDKEAKKVAMAHSMDRILYMASDPKEPVVGLVAKNPGKDEKYCHVFKMTQKSRAKELHKKISEAFDQLAAQEAEAEAGGVAPEQQKGGNSGGTVADGSGGNTTVADANAALALATIAESVSSTGKHKTTTTASPSSRCKATTTTTGGSKTALFAASG